MLEELGHTPDEVAAALRAKGISGIRNTVRHLNPVVRYTATLFPEASGIDIIQGDRLRIVFARGDPTEVPVPEAVLGFLERFHGGDYPDLETADEVG